MGRAMSVHQNSVIYSLREVQCLARARRSAPIDQTSRFGSHESTPRTHFLRHTAAALSRAA
jgi:hypothetical protein